MIIVVHSLYFVIRYALRWYRRQQTRQAIRLSVEQRQLEAVASTEKPAALPLDPEECLVFPIPVYRQRYSTVQDVLLDSRWRKDVQKVVDFGCAEFGFFQYLKHLLGVTDVLEVDIDETLLKENMFRVQPLTADFLKQRSNPLTVEILRGSVSDPDWRIKGIDAVVGIEIIEHLYPDVLDALPYNIFGYAQPKLAIFTTPNADFNVLFPNFKGFRHDDHKFEWTREQFEDWGLNIASRFPNYSVTFAGIGKGPKGTESLGCCSQMAVFVKEYDIVQSEVPESCGHAPRASAITDRRSVGVCTHYSFSNAQMALLSDDLFDIPIAQRALKDGGGRESQVKRCDEYYTSIGVIKYPYEEDLRTPDEKLLHLATQEIYRHATPMSRYFNEDTEVVEIPLYEVVTNFDGQFATEAEMRVLLEAAGFKIAECTLYGTEERCLCVQYDMAEQSSKTASDCEAFEPGGQLADRDEDEDDAWNALPPLAADEGGSVGVHNRNVNSSNDSDWELDERAVRVGQASKDDAATPSDPLVDSGYQKSLSNAEWSPQSPIDGHFDEQFVPKLDVNDIKDAIKGGNGSGLKFPPTTTAPPSLGGSAKAQSPIPGSSRRRKAASHGGSRRSDSEDSASSAQEDVKSIADVLMYNSLNKLNILDVPLVEHVVLPVERPQDLELPLGPQFIVENGDLANNNRDGEGNNYPEVNEVIHNLRNLEFEQHADDPNENVQQQHQVQRNHENHDQDDVNRNVGVNPDDGIVADAPPPQPAPMAAAQVPLLEIVDVHVPAPPAQPVLVAEDEEELNHASREALFDPNSQADLLEDGSITDDTAEFETDAEAEAEPPPGDESVTPVNNLFPHWLLQLLGGVNHLEIVGEEEDAQNGGDEDEAHFYCQGDGLGVHPSLAEVDVDTSSSSSSTDEAQAERTISENDVGSLPTDGVLTNADALAIFGRALDIPFVMLEQTSSSLSQDSGAEEFFDTVAEPSSSSSAPRLRHPNHTSDSNASTSRPDSARDSPGRSPRSDKF